MNASDERASRRAPAGTVRADRPSRESKSLSLINAEVESSNGMEMPGMQMPGMEIIGMLLPAWHAAAWRAVAL